MEFSEKVVRNERVLLAVFLAVLGATLRLESRSTLAAAIRAGRPWSCALETSGPSGRRSLLVYQPARRLADVVAAGERLDEGLAGLPADAAAAGPSLRWPAPRKPLGEDAVDARQSVFDAAGGLAFWRRLPRALAALRGLDLEPLLLAVELHKLAPGQLRAAWLPETEDDRKTLFENILSSETSRAARPVAAEVLNATRQAGVASAAKDVLRLQGVDVVNVGNWTGEPVSRTLVYDRAGRAEAAQLVRDALGCPDAQTATRMTPSKLVDVTVILAEDCPNPGQRGREWNLSRY